MALKRQVVPNAWGVSIEPSPFSPDAKDKMLVIDLPLEGEQLLLPLSDSQLTTLHDGTIPFGIRD